VPYTAELTSRWSLQHFHQPTIDGLSVKVRDMLGLLYSLVGSEAPARLECNDQGDTEALQQGWESSRSLQRSRRAKGGVGERLVLAVLLFPYFDGCSALLSVASFLKNLPPSYTLQEGRDDA
jgi:hypothetical protein